MRRVSRKQAARLRVYSQLRRQFLEARPWCEAPGCGQPASEVHHRAGRVGALLLDTETWLPVCARDHHWITEHPAEAYELGLSERRVGRAS